MEESEDGGFGLVEGEEGFDTRDDDDDDDVDDDGEDEDRRFISVSCEEGGGEARSCFLDDFDEEDDEDDEEDEEEDEDEGGEEREEERESSFMDSISRRRFDFRLLIRNLAISLIGFLFWSYCLMIALISLAIPVSKRISTVRFTKVKEWRIVSIISSSR